MKPLIRALRFTAVLSCVFLVIEGLMFWLRPSPAAFARPHEILLALPQFFDPNGSLADVLATAERTLVAFFLAVPIGLLAGLTVTKAPLIRTEGTFFLDFLRSIPATALVPLFLVIFGLGSASKIAVGAFTGSLSIAISVIIGFDSINAERARLADQVRFRGWRRVAFYELFEILPSLLVGARTAASLCLILVVVAEMFIGSSDGIGKIINDRRYSDDVPTLYAAIVIAGALGYLLNLGFRLVERQLYARIGLSRGVANQPA